MPETTTSRIKDLSQKRAKFAFENVTALKSEPWAGEFKSHVKDVPMMIRTNGLTAAYAFVFSKSKKKDYKRITEITQNWLIEQKVFPMAESDSLHEKLLHITQQQYRWATKEIVALFTWLKRYCDGMIQD